MESADRNKGLSRRGFMGRAAAAAAAFTIVPRHVLGGPGHVPPSEKLHIAGIGIGGRGEGDLDECGSENIVALCDVDEAYAGKVFAKYPKARKWTDFRRMLDEQKDIDAVIVATPDHSHAVIVMNAIKRGKHVYCEKPLAHCIWECRRLTLAAREAGVATQLGNQGQATIGNRLACEFIWAGALGKVSEVHSWCNRYISPRGMERPQRTDPVPATLNWDLWLGPARWRPYAHETYLPFDWRGWWDFGTGVLGDIGCHQFDAIFRALKLGYPTTVEACSSGFNEETAPLSSLVRYEFPERDGMPPVSLSWYDGGLMPQRPAELAEGYKFGEQDDNLYVGDKGLMLGHRLIPESRMKEYGRPPEILPRSPGHHQEWIDACKGGPAARANFDWAGPLTEVVLFGVIALRMEKELYEKGLKLRFDSEKMQVTNLPEANKYVRDEYRRGWSLGIDEG